MQVDGWRVEMRDGTGRVGGRNEGEKGEDGGEREDGDRREWEARSRQTEGGMGAVGWVGGVREIGSGIRI